jgi:hypothetical protein
MIEARNGRNKFPDPELIALAVRLASFALSPGQANAGGRPAQKRTQR